MAEDIRIIKRVLSGEIEAFELLVERYQKPVIGMIGNLIGDKHAQEDIAQEVFLAAYRKLSSFDQSRSRFSTWLFTIARNKSINSIRKKRAIPTSNLPEKIDSTDPSSKSEQAEFFEHLNRVLENLPGKFKRAFVLAEFEGLSYLDIAQIEGAKLGAIKTRIHRAKTKLAKALKQYKAD